MVGHSRPGRHHAAGGSPTQRAAWLGPRRANAAKSAGVEATEERRENEHPSWSPGSPWSRRSLPASWSLSRYWSGCSALRPQPGRRPAPRHCSPTNKNGRR